MELLIFLRVRSSHTASVMAYAVIAQAGQMIDNGLKTAKNLAMPARGCQIKGGVK
jgi:hypothetical protein